MTIYYTTTKLINLQKNTHFILTIVIPVNKNKISQFSNDV